MSGEVAAGDRVVATVPVRLADVGGWTDTWFGSPGRVCHVAVGPAIEVAARTVPRADLGHESVRARLLAPSLPSTAPVEVLVGQTVQPSESHPLLAHAVVAVLDGIDLDGLGVELVVISSVPAGASLGTSASVVVGILAALDSLVAGGERTPEQIAVLAHDVETERAGRQAGVQDQWAAAMGGVGLLAIGPYPQVRHEAVDVAPGVFDEMGNRLVTVAFGPHDSSQVHAQVIQDVVTCSGAEHDRARQALQRLSVLAGEAADALRSGDLERWGEVLAESTSAQAALHPDLVGRPHRAAIDAARALGAVGWKVNGAGGDGGSLTVLASASGPSGRELATALVELDRAWTVVALRPGVRGVRVDR